MEKLLVSSQADFDSRKYFYSLIVAVKFRTNSRIVVALKLRLWGPVRMLSWRHWRFGEFVLIVFVVTQAIDGVLTYVGIRRFGTEIEANALIAWYSLSLGLGGALIGAKAFAVMCAAILYLNKRHAAIGVLTIVYLVSAVWPWTRLLLR